MPGRQRPDHAGENKLRRSKLQKSVTALAADFTVEIEVIAVR